LIGLFKEQPQKFLDFYRNDLLKRSSDTERFTGNIVIFLAGNVLKFQRDVTSAVTEKGANECAQMTRDTNIPFYRNPDCLVYFTKKLLKDTGAMQEMESAVGMVLGKKIYAELGQSKYGGDSNSLALRSRLGPIRFISPPDSAIFRKFLQGDLARLAESFKNETGVDIIFDPSVVNDFLFPSYVNALLGFRNLIDRGTNHFSLLFNTRIKSIVSLFNNRQTMHTDHAAQFHVFFHNLMRRSQGNIGFLGKITSGCNGFLHTRECPKQVHRCGPRLAQPHKRIQ
jgi:hypothetical protein